MSKEKEIATMGVYRRDLETLKDMMKKGEFFRDKFHEMVLKETMKEKKK